MGVDLGSPRAAVPQVLLDDPQVDAGLEQMGGVGMAQSVDMGALDDAGALQRQSEGTLEAAAGDRATVMGQAVLQQRVGAGNNHSGEWWVRQWARSISRVGSNDLNGRPRG